MPMRRRVLVAECKQEVSTFNPNLSRIGDFGVRRGNQILDYHRTIRNEIGGALGVLESDPRIDLVPTYSAFFITSGGTLAQSDWEILSKDFIEGIRQGFASGPIDGIYFCMHGAMCSVSGYPWSSRWISTGSPHVKCSNMPMRLSLITPIPMSISIRPVRERRGCSSM